jgi:hypothetical protein
VDTWEGLGEGLIFGILLDPAYCDGFEVHDMVLDCNAANNPKYTLGERVGIVIPLVTTSRVETVALHWSDAQIPGRGWHFGPAQQFSLCTRMAGNGDYVTNCSAISSTGRVDIVPVGADTDEIVVQLERRAAGVDFYSLAEIEVAGAAVSLPSATVPGGGESRLDLSRGEYSILQAVDGNEGTAWASGPENQVQIVLPLQSATALSQLNLHWNCHAMSGLGRLGPAADYQIQARDPVTLQFYEVAFVRQQRTTDGVEVNTFGTQQSTATIITDQIRILLNTKEPTVDFYSLREVTLQNGLVPVPLKLPSALNHLSWGVDYHILRAFDGDTDTQWACGTQGMVGAIGVVGNNLKFTRLKVIGFGTKLGRECFPMGVTTPPPWEGGPLGFGNVLIEDCVFTDPATNNTDGLTTVVVADCPAARFPHILTNAIVRGCRILGVRSYFAYATGFTALDVENCLVSDCGAAVYFEPDPSLVDRVGPVLIRSNQFLNVNNGVYLGIHSAGRFDSLTCLGNEIVLAGAGGWGFAACDVCDLGPSGSITSVTALNNVVRYADWSVRPANSDGGLFYSAIQNAVFGNNVIVLGTGNDLRVRQCPAGLIVPPPQPETCDTNNPIVPGDSVPSYPPCLDVLPPGYRRAWFNNRDRLGALLEVRYSNLNVDGPASQQQWP